MPAGINSCLHASNLPANHRSSWTSAGDEQTNRSSALLSHYGWKRWLYPQKTVFVLNKKMWVRKKNNVSVPWCEELQTIHWKKCWPWMCRFTSCAMWVALVKCNHLGPGLERHFQPLFIGDLLLNMTGESTFRKIVLIHSSSFCVSYSADRSPPTKCVGLWTLCAGHAFG